MDIDYFKDILFDLINESNDLDIRKIDANDKEGLVDLMFNLYLEETSNE